MQNIRLARIRSITQPLKPKAYAPPLSTPLNEVLAPLELGRQRRLAGPADAPRAAARRDGDASEAVRVSRAGVPHPEGSDCLGLGWRAVGGGYFYRVDEVFGEDEAGDVGEGRGGAFAALGGPDRDKVVRLVVRRGGCCCLGGEQQAREEE